MRISNLNKHTAEEICRNCQRPFLKNTIPYKRLRAGRRGANCRTCSSECSREFYYKSKKEYDKNYSKRPEVKKRVRTRQFHYEQRPEVKKRRKEYRILRKLKDETRFLKDTKQKMETENESGRFFEEHPEIEELIKKVIKKYPKHQHQTLLIRDEIIEKYQKNVQIVDILYFCERKDIKVSCARRSLEERRKQQGEYRKRGRDKYSFVERLGLEPFVH